MQYLLNFDRVNKEHLKFLFHNQSIFYDFLRRVNFPSYNLKSNKEFGSIQYLYTYQSSVSIDMQLPQIFQDIHRKHKAKLDLLG